MLTQIPAYVVTEQEAQEVAKLYQEIDFWADRANKSDWDSFSLTEFVSHGAKEDIHRKIELIMCGGFHEFFCLMNERGEIVKLKPEQVTNRYSSQDEWKWVVNGKALAYRPKRESTLAKYGYHEGYAIRKARLVSNKESLHSCLSRGSTVGGSLEFRLDKQV